MVVTTVAIMTMTQEYAVEIKRWNESECLHDSWLSGSALNTSRLRLASHCMEYISSVGAAKWQQTAHSHIQHVHEKWLQLDGKHKSLLVNWSANSHGRPKSNLPIPAWPTIHVIRMKSITPHMFNMQRTCTEEGCSLDSCWPKHQGPKPFLKPHSPGRWTLDRNPSVFEGKLAACVASCPLQQKTYQYNSNQGSMLTFCTGCTGAPNFFF